MATILLALLLGFVLGYVSKGITITINHKGQDISAETISTEHLLAPDVRQYYDEQGGIR